MPPSILNLFLSGDRVPGACSGSVMGWPGIAVLPGSAHFPTKIQMVNMSKLTFNLAKVFQGSTPLCRFSVGQQLKSWTTSSTGQVCPHLACYLD